MADLRTLLANLRDLEPYLSQVPPPQQSARFEHLVTEALSHILHLPFYTKDNDDTSVEYRVVWNGSTVNWSKAPGGLDGIACAYEFCMLLEATLKTGKPQWAQECAPCIDRYGSFVAGTGRDKRDCYLLMILTELHDYTYTSIKERAAQGDHFVLLPVAQLATVLETISLAFTTKHLDIRLLWNSLQDCCAKSEHKDDFLNHAVANVTAWQNELLKKEKTTFLGIKSYHAMRRIGNVAATSEILQQLYGDSIVERYYRTLDATLNPSDIEASLEQEKLGYCAGRILTGEPLYAPVPILDVKGRARLFIKELENATAEA